MAPLPLARSASTVALIAAFAASVLTGCQAEPGPDVAGPNNSREPVAAETSAPGTNAADAEASPSDPSAKSSDAKAKPSRPKDKPAAHTRPPEPAASSTTVEAAPPGRRKQAAPGSRVTRVIDGDTVELRNGRGVRLLGIDTPEEGDCGYDAATRHLERLVLGHRVRLIQATEDTDRYGRLLRYVLTRHVDAGLRQIQSGQAIARYDSRDGYGPHPREKRYIAADANSPSTHHCRASKPDPAPQAGPSTKPKPRSVYYENCTAVAAAGAAPIYRRDPGYSTDLDADGDGVACEV